ncbi:MAG: hypothetical protein GXO91_03125 [FCB group bacterium]|nr:hypothetical protein [FCB group bacterium]
MRIQTIPFSKLAKQSEDIYEDVMIPAKRAKQIIDERVEHREPYEEVADDAYNFSDLEPNENYEEKEKAIGVALEEFLNGELEWSVSESHEEL